MSTQRRNAAQSERDPDMAGAETAMHRAARRALRRAQEITPGLKGREQSETAGRSVTIRNPSALSRSWRHTTVERLPHDPVQFDVLDLLDAVGRLHGISIDNLDSKDQILDIVKKAARQEFPATRLHGRRIEAMFGYVAAAMGRCSLIKKEDNRPAFARDPDMKIPDYRLVNDDGQQFLVEVKNCHKKKLDSRVVFKAQYLSELQAYSALVRAELRLAIYWSIFKMWTLISPQDLRLDGSDWTTTFGDAMMQNSMAALGDMHVGTTPPLVCRLLQDPDRPPKIDANGGVDFTIQQVQIECAGRRVTDNNEKNLALQLILFGEWPVSERLLIDAGRLLGVEHLAEPIASTPGQGFEFVGSLSRMASQRFDELTAPSGRIERLAPNSGDAGRLTPAIPAHYVGRQLPLWLLVQQPFGKSENKGEPSG